MSDYSISIADSNNEIIILTDSIGNIIQFRNIENITIGNISYDFYTERLYVNGASQEIDNLFWDESSSTVYGFSNALMSLSGYYDPGEGILGNFSGLSPYSSNDITYIGSSSQDILNLGSDRTEYTGNLNIFLEMEMIL